MSTVERGQRAPMRTAIGVVAVVASIAAALALLWIADELHYRGCIEHAEAEFPTIPVSAYLGRSRSDTGPLKVSFSAQRAMAVNSCHHF